MKWTISSLTHLSVGEIHNLLIPVVMVGLEPTFEVISTTSYEYRAYKTPSVHHNIEFLTHTKKWQYLLTLVSNTLSEWFTQWDHNSHSWYKVELVVPIGIEPMLSHVSGGCFNQLS